MDFSNYVLPSEQAAVELYLAARRVGFGPKATRRQVENDYPEVDAAKVCRIGERAFRQERSAQ